MTAAEMANIYLDNITFKEKVCYKNIFGILILKTNTNSIYTFKLTNENKKNIEKQLKEILTQIDTGILEVKFVFDIVYQEFIMNFFKNLSIKYRGVFYQLNLKPIDILVKKSDLKILVAGINEIGIKCSWKPREKVLIIDDSATIRKIIRESLNDNENFEVVGEASNGEDGAALTKKLNPDYVTLDINMPILDGLGYLQKMKRDLPTVILISSIEKNEGDQVMHCLEQGAFDYLQKPSFKNIEFFKKILIKKLELASESRESMIKMEKIHSWQGLNTFEYNDSKIIAIGASTGGTEAIKEVLLRLPKEIPPIFIVQHIPPVFSAAFAKKLNDLCPFEVVEAHDGQEVKNNTVYIAPGGKHMGVNNGRTRKMIVIDEETEAVSGHKPSVDYMYDNLIKRYKAKNIVGVLLTGMGSDGARKLKNIKDQGGFTISQDESTSVVYGMPKKAMEFNSSCKELPLMEIASEIIDKIKV